MKISVLQNRTPAVETRSGIETALSDTPPFSQLLDEKKNAAASQPQPANGGVAAGRAQPKAEHAKSADAEAPEDTADTPDASLQALLNLCQAGCPPDEAENKEKLSLADDQDPQPGPLPSDSIQPLPAQYNPQLVADATAPAALPPSTPDSEVISLTTTSVATQAEQPTLPGLTLISTANSAAKPGAQHPIDPATTPTDRPATPARTYTDNPGVNPVELPSASTLNPVNQDALPQGENQTMVRPEFSLSTPAVAQRVNDAATGQIPATGHLTQEMGTPAWQASLGQQLACFTRNGIQHAELRLHPEELGSLQITLQLKNEQAQMHFVSPSHQVRAAIEAAMPHLRSSLAESGIELGQSSVGPDSSQGWNDSGQSGQPERQNFADTHVGDNQRHTEDPVEIPAVTVSYSHGINTFA